MGGACEIDYDPAHRGKMRSRDVIPAYIRLPKAAANGMIPVVLLMTGLDEYRQDNTQRTNEFLARRWACVVAKGSEAQRARVH